MRLYKKVVMNGCLLDEYPFEREFELAGCLASNPELLSVGEDELLFSELIDMEVFIKKGRRDHDGRADMIVSYMGGRIGIVEIKKGMLDQRSLKQLDDYLEGRNGLATNEALLAHKERIGEEINLSDSRTYIGVLVGTDIKPDMIDELKQRKKGAEVFAIVLNRYKNGNDGYLIFSNVYGPLGRDNTRYSLNGSSKLLCKGRLVLEAIGQYVRNQRTEISYAELEAVFPKKLRGVKQNGYGCFAKAEDALKYAKSSHQPRHFLGEQEIIRLKDCSIAVSSQWNLQTIDRFIAQLKKIGIKVAVHKTTEK